MLIYRYATPVIGNRNTTIFKDSHVNTCTMTSNCFVYRIIGNFFN